MESEWWLLTWRTYGTFLPGEAGFVGYYRDKTGNRVIDNVYDSPTARPIPALADYSRRIQTEEACFLDSIQAQRLLSQFRETCEYRGWSLLAVAILANHIHAVLVLPDTVDGSKAMTDLKSYGSRALNRLSGGSIKHSWWAVGVPAVASSAKNIALTLWNTSADRTLRWLCGTTAIRDTHALTLVVPEDQASSTKRL